MSVPRVVVRATEPISASYRDPRRSVRPASSCLDERERPDDPQRPTPTSLLRVEIRKNLRSSKFDGFQYLEVELVNQVVLSWI